MTEERRLVTVLFADVSGSTALGEALDPEDMRALLRRFFAIAREIVESHGGVVEKFIGDAVMAVFGLPAAHGDDAERALSAALEIRDRVRADPHVGDRLPIRLGVNTGEVVATRDLGEGLVDASGAGPLITGDAVNVAARLQQDAGDWAIVAGERTARAAHAAFSFGPPRDVAARGKSNPVRARLLLGRIARLARRVPIVGRDADLAQLQLVARRALTERRPFLVSLIAPAGTGKTRLLEEFLDQLPTDAPGATVAIAQCLPYGQRLTYWPLRAVLHRLTGIDEDAPPEVIRDGLARWLSDAGEDEPERLGDLLAATIGAGDTEAADPSMLFAAWRRLVELAAARAPLVVVFEDLHWSSDSLLDLVESLMQPHGDLPLLMVVLTRPELLDRRRDWGGGRRNYTSIALEPLRDDAVGQLVRSLLEDASPELVTAVAERSEGNPFYAGEIVRSVVERLDPAAASGADIARLLATLPDTVQATVLARLDQLPTDERRVLQVGSVFGRSFRPGGVSALEPAIAEGVAGAVDVLLDRDLVRPSGADALAFRHILIREVAYQTLPRAERSRLHDAAGRWLEERSAGREEAYAELIAYHSREAATLSRALGADADPAIARRAVAWLERAADAALAAGALVEVQHHLQAAIELAEPDQLPWLHERIAETALDGALSVESFDRALELVRAGGGATPDQLLRLLSGLLTFHTRWLGAVPQRPGEDQLMAMFAEANEMFALSTDDRARARLRIAEAFLTFWRRSEGLPVTDEHLGFSAERAREGLAIAERVGDVALQSGALDALFSLAQDRCLWREALVYERRRVAFGNRLDLREMVDAQSGLAWAASTVGDLEEAASVAEAGLAALQPGQVPNWAMHLAGWGAYAALLLGQWDRALRMATRSRQTWIDIGRTPASYAVPGYLAAFAIVQTRQDPAATALWAETVETVLARFHGNPRYVLMRAFLSGDPDFETSGMVDAVYSRPSDVERAMSFATDWGRRLPKDVLEETGRLGAQYELKPLLAQARRAQGLANGSPEALREALALLEEMRAVPEIGRVHVELGRMVGDSDMVERGRRELASLGDLDQLDRYGLTLG